MTKFIFTAAALCLAGFTSTSMAQTVNVTQIRGNSNTVVNSNRGVSGPTTNLNQIRGNGNTVINSTRGFTPTLPSVQPVILNPLPVPCIQGLIPTLIQGPVQVLPAEPTFQPTPVIVPQPTPVFVPQPTPVLNSVPVNLNLNLNQVRGNNNTVVNRNSGVSLGQNGINANININQIRGNGNTVINRNR